MTRFLLAFAMAVLLTPAAFATPKETNRDKDLYNYGPSSPSGVDVTNPMAIMNMLQNMSTGGNATPPGDAVDAALSDFDWGSDPTSTPSKTVPSGL